MGEILSFNEFLDKYKYKKTDEVIAYELYLIIEIMIEKFEVNGTSEAIRRYKFKQKLEEL